MDRKTLIRIRERGDITGRIKRVGRVKRHSVFTIADVAKYLRSTRAVEAHRKGSLEYLRAELVQHPLEYRGMRVSLLKPRRKSKAVSNLKKSDQGAHDS